ncbi:sortase [Candidatus Saccharibacteria bacterium]|jgi:LPXTG-site transpeptidase (sortase) family protein|nr:sortase [Candidatus Saccharibacteria bacterium]
MPNDKKDDIDDNGAKAAALARAKLQSIYSGGRASSAAHQAPEPIFQPTQQPQPAQPTNIAPQRESGSPGQPPEPIMPLAPVVPQVATPKEPIYIPAVDQSPRPVPVPDKVDIKLENNQPRRSSNEQPEAPDELAVFSLPPAQNIHLVDDAKSKAEKKVSKVEPPKKITLKPQPSKQKKPTKFEQRAIQPLPPQKVEPAPPKPKQPKPQPALVAKKHQPAPKESVVQVQRMNIRAAEQDKIGHNVNKPKKKHRSGRLKALLSAVTVVIIVMITFQNQVIIGQVSYYTSPGDRVDVPVITDITIDQEVAPESKVIIPKINVNVPVNYDITTYDEATIQRGLENGVVHYANTALPGQVGNNVILGHNTNNFWNSGNYKTAFVLLDRLENGDTIELHYNSKRYVYEVFNKKVVEPNDFSLINQQVQEPIVSLITCTPPGTSWQRLFVQARQISPVPDKSKPENQADVPTTGKSVPSAPPSLLNNLLKSFF